MTRTKMLHISLHIVLFLSFFMSVLLTYLYDDTLSCACMWLYNIHMCVYVHVCIDRTCMYPHTRAYVLTDFCPQVEHPIEETTKFITLLQEHAGSVMPNFRIVRGSHLSCLFFSCACFWKFVCTMESAFRKLGHEFPMFDFTRLAQTFLIDSIDSFWLIHLAACRGKAGDTFAQCGGLFKERKVFEGFAGAHFQCSDETIVTVPSCLPHLLDTYTFS